MRGAFCAALIAIGIALIAAAAIGRRGVLVLFGLVALVGSYAVSLGAFPEPTAAASAPLVGALLLVLGECTFIAVDRDEMTRSELLRRLTWAAGAGLGATIASSLVLLAWSVRVSQTIGVTIAGTICAVAIVVLLSAAARTPQADHNGEANDE
jgi:hypothetical protein